MILGKGHSCPLEETIKQDIFHAVTKLFYQCSDHTCPDYVWFDLSFFLSVHHGPRACIYTLHLLRLLSHSFHGSHLLGMVRELSFSLMAAAFSNWGQSSQISVGEKKNAEMGSAFTVL